MDVGNGQKQTFRGIPIKEIGVFCSILLSTYSFAKVVFFAGGEEVRIEEHLRYLDQRIDRDEKQFADAKEVDLRLQFVERNIEGQKEILKEQTKVFEQIERELEKKTKK